MKPRRYTASFAELWRATSEIQRTHDKRVYADIQSAYDMVRFQCALVSAAVFLHKHEHHAAAELIMEHHMDIARDLVIKVDKASGTALRALRRDREERR